MSAMTAPATGIDGRYLLERPPLQLAVFEVRYPRVAEGVTIAHGIAIRDAIAAAIGVTFPAVEMAAAHEITLTVGPEGPTEQTSRVEGVQLSDLESGFVATVFPEVTTLQTQMYARWSTTLRPVVRASLQAVGLVLEPAARTRVGLRYVNRFTDVEVTTPQIWGERIEPSLAGPLVSGPFSAQVASTQHQLELDLGAGVGAMVRHGCVLEPGPRRTYSYLLDIDVYNGTTQVFDAEEALVVTEHLNRHAAELFRRAMRPTYAELLGLHGVPPSERGDDT